MHPRLIGKAERGAVGIAGVVEIDAVVPADGFHRRFKGNGLGVEVAWCMRAEDMQLEEGYFTVTTAMENFGAMMKKLETLKIEPENAQLQRIPKDTTKLDLESSKKVMRLIELFEEDDDIQAVYHNLEMTDELMDSL